MMKPFTLGLQRRILLYAAAGLALLFAAWGVVGSRAVDSLTRLIFEERITTADFLAGTLGREFEHMAGDVREGMERISTDSTSEARAEALAAVMEHLSETDQYEYFQPAAIVLVDTDGNPLAVTPSDFPFPGRDAGLLERGVGDLDGFYAFSVSGLAARPGVIPVVAVPVADSGGRVTGTAYLLLDTVSTKLPQLFRSTPEGAETAAVRGTDIEVMDRAGRALIGVRSEEERQLHREHARMFADMMKQGEAGLVVHRRSGDVSWSDHTVAAIPIPKSNMYLLFEEHEDRAMTTPARLREQFVLIAVFGFVAAMLVAWLTTRRVVRPTEQLTAAAERMAGGDLESPIRVKAQDEIGRLSESVESMRRQLAKALKELAVANRALESRVRERTAQLREALRHVMSAQEEERKRLSRELHDQVAQSLVILARGIDELRGHVEEEGAQRVGRLHELAREILSLIRQFSRDLRPSLLDDLGLFPALSWVGNQTRERSGLQVTVESTGEPRRLDPDAELALFRIVQEALHNAERHSGAAAVEVNLASGKDLITVEIRDDGRGFEVPSRIQDLAQEGKFGLIGISERAALAGGTLRIASSPGQGTLIRVSLAAPAKLDGARGVAARRVVAS